jgi:hypothetical protein
MFKKLSLYISLLTLFNLSYASTLSSAQKELLQTINAVEYGGFERGSNTLFNFPSTATSEIIFNDENNEPCALGSACLQSKLEIGGETDMTFIALNDIAIPITLKGNTCRASVWVYKKSNTTANAFKFTVQTDETIPTLLASEEKDFNDLTQNQWYFLTTHSFTCPTSNTITVKAESTASTHQNEEVLIDGIFVGNGIKPYFEHKELQATSDVFPVSTSGYTTLEYAQMSNNSITLTPGTWELTGFINLDGSGSPTIYLIEGRYATANGDNTSTPPSMTRTISPNFNKAIFSDTVNETTIDFVTLQMPTVTTVITSETTNNTIYIVGRVGYDVGNPGSTSIQGFIKAKRLDK